MVYQIMNAEGVISALAVVKDGVFQLFAMARVRENLYRPGMYIARSVADSVPVTGSGCCKEAARRELELATHSAILNAGALEQYFTSLGFEETGHLGTAVARLKRQRDTNPDQFLLHVDVDFQHR